ncbi:MAG: serine/threonine-protein kinase [Acidobacteria bacterium]|nr:serine/threonine-protein kinase [Acidobacteriota bacterium]
MSLAPGVRLGPYHVLAPLGAGGMGEVWSARDTRLDRVVALKVLPPAFTATPDRVSRFAREARVLAQLRHPGIAAVHSFEEIDGRPILVMELAEGDTLAHRMARGPLPLAEAVSLARQIAEALEAAHEKGIVHRDLKPANVKVSPAGKVKLLDFGLAKAWASDSDAGVAVESALTETTPGVILGTVSYMPPEQARGLPVDRRADVWSFGVVLFEMLTGRRLFDGETRFDVLASVLTRDPDFTLLPEETPENVRRVLRRCLVRDAANRLHDIADARLELAETDGPSSAGPPSRGPASQAPASPAPSAASAVSGAPRSRSALLALVAALLLLTAAGSAFLTKRLVRKEPPVFRNISWAHGDVFSARLTPDGQNVVYSAAFDGRPLALYTARLDALEARVLDVPAGDVAGISQNGELAFLEGRRNTGSWKRVGTLMQVSLSGGSPRPVLGEVYAADIAPDGASFAVVRDAGPGQQLEYPVGTVLHRSTGWISHPRISKDGERVAFFDHDVDGDDLGSVSIANRKGPGTVQRLSPQLDYSQGLTWSPSGEEVWATCYRVEEGAILQAFSPSRPPRVLLRIPSTARILDAGADGRILLTYDDTHVELEGKLAGDGAIRSYSWWRASFVTGISHDGTLFAGDGAMSLARGGNVAFSRRAGGAPPVRLGDGAAAGVSADASTVFLAAASRTRLTAVPTGPGEPREFDLGTAELSITGTRSLSATTDGKLLAFTGRAKGGDLRGFLLDLESGASRPVTPEGIDEVLLSPDGQSIAGVARGKGIVVFPIAGGEGAPLAGTANGELPGAWDGSSRSLFVWDRRIPVQIQRVDLATGVRRLALEVAPRDPSGVLYAHVRFTPDLRYFLLRFRRHTSYLAVVTGVD